MKTRNALVSNSSSSSFILIGIPIEISQLTEKHIVNPKSELSTIVIGRYLGEGQDVFPLYEKEQLQFILDYPQLFNRAFTSCKYQYEGSIGIEFKSLYSLAPKIDLPKLLIFGGTADQASSYNIEEMLRNYEGELEEQLKTTAINQLKQKYGVKEKC